MEIIQIVLLCLILIVGLLNLFKKSNSSLGKNNDSKDFTEKIENESRTIREAVKDTLSVGNNTLISGVKATNDAVIDNVKLLSDTNQTKISEMREELSKSLEAMRQSIEKSMKEVKEETSKQMREMRTDNENQLAEMRGIVDTKLSKTLNDRLTQSFSLIHEQLQSVYKGLGEMRDLASGVSDLKKVLTNVKTRGTWGEVSLDNILENILTGDQYTRGAYVGGKQREQVDFAVILPGRGKEKMYLPIDVKFPTEAYQRLVEAGDGNDLAKYSASVKELESTIKEQAKRIQKYINPPETTDFAIMYLCTEGLYAEVLRNAGLMEELQNKYRITPAGPSSITALLNSLRLGFKTLAVQKSSLEVFRAFEEFKKHFGMFVDNIDSAKKHIEKVTDSLDLATKRTGIIQKKLDKIENLLPEGEQLAENLE